MNLLTMYAQILRQRCKYAIISCYIQCEKSHQPLAVVDPGFWKRDSNILKTSAMLTLLKPRLSLNKPRPITTSDCFLKFKGDHTNADAYVLNADQCIVLTVVSLNFNST